MATSSLIGRRFFLAAASRAAAQRQVQATSLRAASAVAASQQSQNHGHHNDSANLLSRFGLLAAAGATLAATSMTEKNKYNAKCCGIAGVVGAKGDARDYLIEGLTILKNRGYDSAGIATMDEKNPSLVSEELACESLVMYIYKRIISNSYHHMSLSVRFFADRH